MTQPSEFDEDLELEERKGGFAQTLKNIPPAARWIMVAVGAVALIAIVIFLKSMGSAPDAFRQAGVPAGAQVDVRLDSGAVTKSENIAGEETATGRKIKELKEIDLDRKRQDQSSSFIEGLELRNNQRITEELNEEQADLARRGGSMLSLNSDLAQKRIAERQQELDERSEALSRQITAQNASSSGRTLRTDGRVQAGAVISSSEQRQNGYYYIDQSGQVVINAQPISQADLLSLRLTGQLMDDKKVYETARKSAEDAVAEVNVSEYVEAFPEDAAMAVNWEGAEKGEAGAGGNREGAAGPDGGYGAYFERGKQAVAKEKQDMMSLHASLTSDNANAGGMSGQTSASGGYSAGGGVSTYDAPVGQTRLDVTPGEIFYAILEIGVNTDEISPVRATIIQEGKLKGARLIGVPSKTGDKAVIQFSTMSLNGKSYSVDVVALDPDTWRTAMADDVDHHTFSRYFKLATAAALEGYAEALSGQRTVQRSDGSTETIREGLPEAKDQAMYAAGRIGGVLVPKFEADFDRPSTVRIMPNRDLGIMFMSGMDL